MTEKTLNKLQPKKDEPKTQEDYPIWQGLEKAELGVTYRNPKSGNLIRKGNKPLID